MNEGSTSTETKLLILKTFLCFSSSRLHYEITHNVKLIERFFYFFIQTKLDAYLRNIIYCVFAALYFPCRSVIEKIYVNLTFLLALFYC